MVIIVRATQVLQKILAIVSNPIQKISDLPPLQELLAEARSHKPRKGSNDLESTSAVSRQVAHPGPVEAAPGSSFKTPNPAVANPLPPIRTSTPIMRTTRIATVEEHRKPKKETCLVPRSPSFVPTTPLPDGMVLSA